MARRAGLPPLLGPGLLRRARAIRLLVLDVDGVMTDGQIHYDADGREFKSFHVRDGYGIVAVRKAGIEVAVISGRGSGATAGRLRDLGITRAWLEAGDKAAALAALLHETGIPATALAAVGDDAPDRPVLERAALAVAVADAHPGIHDCVHARTRLPGGRGAVREVCDLLLRAAERGR
jgi:3-deoxy-D-manno-octulosonate 8-phosphate phosphatase (KDO 8-P phosphatase)